MRQLLCLAVLGCALMSGRAIAEVASQNPNAIISIIGPDAFNVSSPGQLLGQRFAVRMVDPQGQPIEGLTVDFFSNYMACLPLVVCNLPPEEMYGHFAGNLSWEQVLTDANGVAIADSYFGGTAAGHYEVVAAVYFSSSARNAAILKVFPLPDARFTITQFAAPAVATVPALGPAGIWMLIVALALAASRAVRLSPLPWGRRRSTAAVMQLDLQRECECCIAAVEVDTRPGPHPALRATFPRWGKGPRFGSFGFAGGLATVFRESSKLPRQTSEYPPERRRVPAGCRAARSRLARRPHAGHPRSPAAVTAGTGCRC